MQRTGTHCNAMQHTAMQYHTLQRTATYCNALQCTPIQCNTLAPSSRLKKSLKRTQQNTATNCNTLHRTATHCTTLQHTAMHCNALQHGKLTDYKNKKRIQSWRSRNLQLKEFSNASTTHCYTLLHMATRCNTAYNLKNKNRKVFEIGALARERATQMCQRHTADTL